jgi:bifunctional non-homologous end joining protein LigD
VWDKGIAAFKRASRAGEEGVMAKFARGHYYSGQRTREWLKVKASLGQEVVIVGFTAPRRSRQYFGALVLAVREGNGWRYVGRAGSGFDRESLKSLHALMVPLITKTKPVAEKVPDQGNTTWVKPKLVGEVKFTEWTSKGEMRHPVFLGLRGDKKATDVIREIPKPGAAPAP